MKKNNDDTSEEINNDSLASKEKIDYNKLYNHLINLSIVVPFSIGLFVGIFGIILYAIYDIWSENIFNTLSKSIQKDFVKHKSFIYFLSGAIINLITDYFISYYNVGAVNSIWG